VGTKPPAGPCAPGAPGAPGMPGMPGVPDGPVKVAVLMISVVPLGQAAVDGTVDTLVLIFLPETIFGSG